MPQSYKSIEPADNEDPLRQAFYTDWERPQIIAYFKKEFAPSLELNYPPEEAQTIIRDQTQSRYLEEFTHPFRESIYVNGFFAQKDSERMYAGGREYKTKVIVRYVPSNPALRLIIALTALAIGYKVLHDLFGLLKKIRYA